MTQEEILAQELKNQIKTEIEGAVKNLENLQASKEELSKLTEGLEAVKSDLNKLAENQANKSVDKNLNEALKQEVKDIAKKMSDEFHAGKIGERYAVKTVGDIGLGNIGSGIIQPVQTPISVIRNRTFAMFQLARVFNTTAPIADVTHENEDGAPTYVAETGNKPQVDSDLTPTTYTPQYVAGYMTISRQAMLNLPYLESLLLENLRMRTMNVANSLCLSGNGTSDVIKGALTFAPTFTVSGVHVNGYVNPTLYHALILATTDVYSDDKKEWMPNAILINPIDAAALKIAVIEKQINLPQLLIENGKLFVNGVALYEDPAITSGTVLLGDFNYSNIAIQDSYNVLVDPYTLMLKNQVRLRGEMCLTHYIQKGDIKAFRKFDIATVLADLTQGS